MTYPGHRFVGHNSSSEGALRGLMTVSGDLALISVLSLSFSVQIKVPIEIVGLSLYCSIDTRYENFQY